MRTTGNGSSSSNEAADSVPELPETTTGVGMTLAVEPESASKSASAWESASASASPSASAWASGGVGVGSSRSRSRSRSRRGSGRGRKCLDGGRGVGALLVRPRCVGHLEPDPKRRADVGRRDDVAARGRVLDRRARTRRSLAPQPSPGRLRRGLADPARRRGKRFSLPRGSQDRGRARDLRRRRRLRRRHTRQQQANQRRSDRRQQQRPRRDRSTSHKDQRRPQRPTPTGSRRTPGPTLRSVRNVTPRAAHRRWD